MAIAAGKIELAIKNLFSKKYKNYWDVFAARNKITVKKL